MASPSRPKLLLLNTDLKRGGTPIVVRELAVRLRARRHDVEVSCLADLGEIGAELRNAKVPVHPLNASGQADVAVFRRLANLLREGNYTHVLSFLLHANAALSLVAGFLPKNLRLFQSIQTTQPDPAWHWELQSLIHPSAEKILVPSPSVAAVARERCQIPDEKLVVIPNALDPIDWAIEHPPPLARPWRAHTNPPAALAEPARAAGVSPVLAQQAEAAPPVDLLFLGRLDPVKRIPDLIAALRLLPRHYHLHICGQGPELSHLHQLRNDNPTLNICFHAHAYTPQQALAQADALILPSQAEGFGLVLIEAMAARVPVIASDAPGIRDVVQHERTGLLYPTGDPRLLARAIRRVIDDPTLAHNLTAAAQAHVADAYSWDKALPQYERALGLTPS